MANVDHVELLRQGVERWNAWRREQRDPASGLSYAVLDATSLNREILSRQGRATLSRADLHRAILRDAVLRQADLSRADLRGTVLQDVNLSRADLRGTVLQGANLSRADLYDAALGGANLSGADLSGADLSGAELDGADLSGADLNGADLHDAVLSQAALSRADLSGAKLHRADLSGADLDGTDLGRATLHKTVFTDVDLSKSKGLEDCKHSGPSIIDIHTLQRSGPLPLPFLRGIGLPGNLGLPDNLGWRGNLIDYLPLLLDQAIPMYSCFISYSAKDDDFAQRLHADLQNKGVRCWFAPHDLPIGAKTLDALDEAIRTRDKLLLILSEHSIASKWVEDEVTAAYEEERRHDKTVLFPIRLDDAVFDTREAWAGKLRANRNIGDFRQWKDRDVYRKGLERLLRDLQVGKGAPPGAPTDTV